jgi:heme-degrading monooxygenase HmoA
MIARHWTGISSVEQKDEYISWLKHHTFPQIEAIDGFLSAEIISRDIDQEIEITVITRWRDMRSIKSFAGENPEEAVVPDFVKTLLNSYELLVRHYRIEE